MADVLKKIAAYKADEVEALKSKTSLTELRRQAEGQPPSRGFLDALKRTAPHSPALIAEVKKASPSKGIIRDDFDPASIAINYRDGGAACLSVLTDSPGFQGSAEIFDRVRRSVSLPLLRKDFMLDPIQIAECRAMGADAVLVILAMIDDDAACALIDEAQRHNLDVLVETHDQEELDRALALGAPLIGINNRNLRTFETTLKTFEKLGPGLPLGITVIAESGIFTAEDIVHLTGFGADGFLIGESLMRQNDILIATRRLSFT